LFISDAHLDLEPQQRPTDEALTGFLDDVAHASHRSTTQLVLLGDMFELLGPLGGGVAAAVKRLDEIVACRPQVVAALSRCVQAGVAVDVVAGNHDLDLVRPAVAARLRVQLGVAADDEAVRVWPWLYVVPGVLYAEHGNQHHDLNRFPSILDPYSPHDPEELFTPPLATRDRLVAANAFTRRRHAATIACSLSSSWRGELAARRSAHAVLTRVYAEELGLDATLVLELERLSRVRMARMARRLAERLVTQRGEPPDAYLLSAGRAVHRLTATRGAATPFYVFGHTHVARDLPLDGSSRYLNCGTWSACMRDGDAAAADSLRFPFVEVVSDDHGVRGSLRWWRHLPSAGDASPSLVVHESRS
jgi:UDP-2,3-diacylglucosamine pyrophosphatase LpxH